MDTATILNHSYQLKDQLSNKLGRKTFVADDLKTGNQAIVKILQFNAEFQWEDLKLFEREVVTLKNLNHPAIPKYLDSFGLADGFALVQTYIDAPSLETVVREGRKFSEAEVMELATRLLDILAYLHEQKPPVIHRDIKPSNILLANRSGNSIGDVYLVDFGSVQTVASKEGGTITIVGSYGYIPLEQFGGQTTIASDLYSLGMTLIYLLTGSHPAELPQINGQVKFTAEISSQFNRWLTKITQPHLDKRFESAKLARTALNSEDGSYGDFIHLKPANSKVQLYRDRDKLEIKWQGNNQTDDALNVLGCTIVFIVIFIIFPVFIASALKGASSVWEIIFTFFSSSFMLLFLIALLGTAFMWIGNLLRIIGNFLKIKLPENWSTINTLNIDSKFVYYSKSMSMHTSKTPRSQVEILVYNPGYVFDQYFDGDTNAMRRGEVKIPPKLSLAGDRFEFYFCSNLSKEELWWLGQELSDFLNLELQVIYSTPKVPPTPSCGGGC